MSPASARSASESSSFPPPAATPEQAASLRADLADSGWGVEAVAALLGEAADAARAEIAEHGTIPWDEVKTDLGREGVDGAT